MLRRRLTAGLALAALAARAAASPDAPTVPPAPSSIEATALDAKVKLVWNLSLGATGYVIERSEKPGGPYATVARLGRLECPYTDSSAKNGVTYYYVVVATNDLGQSPPSKEASALPLPIDGGAPYGGVAVAPDGWIYGVTAGGGENGTGVIYRIKADGTYETLHHFPALEEGNFPPKRGQDLTVMQSNDDGAEGYGALLRDKDGTLYGTEARGGLQDCGTVFRLTASGAFSVLHVFQGRYEPALGPARASDGAMPRSGLVVGPDGWMYGTTTNGGENDTGTIYKVSKDGGYQLVHAFDKATDGIEVNADGVHPDAPLLAGPDGALYGTCPDGGKEGGGVAFRIERSGTFRVICSFPTADSEENGDGPSEPRGSLALGADGAVYGTSAGGGPSTNGTIFRIGPAGQLTTVYAFGDSGPGAPEAGLARGADGGFYGTTSSGGSHGYGVLFRVGPGGDFKVLAEFDRNIDVFAAPVAAADGLYIATPVGGLGNGAIVKASYDGALRTLFAFHHSAEFLAARPSL